MADKKKKSKQKDDRHKEEKQKTKRSKQQETPVPVPAQPAAVIAHSQNEPIAMGGTDNAILDGTITCATQYGVAGVTTRRIAALAGVNEVTIFRRFGNKDALMQAVIQREAQRMENDALDYTGDLEADLTRIVAVFVEAAESRQGVLPILLNAGQTSGEARPAAQHSLAPQYSLAAFGTVAQVLVRYMQEGKLRAEAPERALAALVGPVVFGALLQGTVIQPISRNFPALDIPAYVQGYLDGRRIHAKQNA